MKQGSTERIQAEDRFINALYGGHSVTSAAEYAGVPRRRVYDWRDQSQAFANRWTDAIEASADVLEDEVRSRALDRDDKESAKLLMFLLRKMRPQFRDGYDSRHTVVHETVEEVKFNFSDKEMDEAIAILTASKAGHEHAVSEAREQPDDQDHNQDHEEDLVEGH